MQGGGQEEEPLLESFLEDEGKFLRCDDSILPFALKEGNPGGSFPNFMLTHTPKFSFSWAQS